MVTLTPKIDDGECGDDEAYRCDEGGEEVSVESLLQRRLMLDVQRLRQPATNDETQALARISGHLCAAIPVDAGDWSFN